MNTQIRSTLRNLFWTVLAAGVGALCLSAANFKKKTVLTGITVQMAGTEEGLYFMKPENLEKEISTMLGPLNKHTVGDVACDLVEEMLGQKAFIENADVYVNSNGVLTARITQREPLLRVMAAGQNFYIDKSGKRMPHSPYYTPRVHVVTGPMAARQAEDLIELVKALREDEVLDAMIGQIHYADKGEIILIPTVGHAQVLFGGPERLTEKFENLKAFYSEVVAVNGWDRYHIIDLRYRNQIICKKNPTS